MADSTPTSTKSTCSTTISSSSSMKTARLARFAEATTVHSPIDPPQHAHSPFADPAPPPPPQKHAPSDVGFGYISSAAPADDSSIRTQTLTIPHSSGGGPKSPLKSALKSPGAAPTPRRTDAILSPTFKEESLLEKQEVDTEKVQAQDLVSEQCTSPWQASVS